MHTSTQLLKYSQENYTIIKKYNKRTHNNCILFIILFKILKKNVILKRECVTMERFRPDIYKKSIYDIDYEKLKKIGIRCLLFDLDNTLAPIDVLEPDKKLLDFFGYLESLGFKSIILSNSSKKRVTPFKERCNVDSSFHSYKPFRKKYRKVLDMFGYEDTEIACIGDQLLTDVYGANRMGFTSILVNPISEREYFGTKINRFIETILYRYYKKRNLLDKGSYYE